MSRLLVTLMLCAVFVTWKHVHSKGQFDWMAHDHFDEVDEQIRSVNAQNCRSKNKEELILRMDTVAQRPVYNQLLSRIWYRNRTSLIHIHNMALNRAFFFSYVLQRMNDSATFNKQPNWLYFYFSATADVNANPYMLNGSALYFDTHCHYPNWYTTVPFNRTLPLFAPKAFRWDDFRDQDNFLREPTRRVVQVRDAGAGRFMNYTHSGFKMSPWYNNWLPDTAGDMDSLTKFTYYIHIRRSNETGKFMDKEFKSYAFFGPAQPSARETDERKLPVVFTPPYYDCGGSNKWVVSTVSPVADFMPRYSNYTHLRRQRFVGVVVMDTDFIKLDFNACGVSPGNPGPSYLSGIARCRPTTGCKHKMGYGFRRGGYVCVCKSGWSYPWWLDPPFQGESVEQASEVEYNNGFQCTPTNFRLALPVVDSLSGTNIEGGGVVINSGGLQLEKENNVNDDDNNERRKRSVINNTLFSEGPRAGDRNVPGSGKQATFPQEQLKRFTEGKTTSGLRKVEVEMEARNSFSSAGRSAESYVPIKQIHCRDGSTKCLNGSQIDDYALRNSVSYEVEKQYETDVAGHQAYKKYLFDAGLTVNRSFTEHALRDNIMRLRDLHIERFHSERHTGHRHRRKKRSAVFDQQAFDRMMRILRQMNSVTPRTCHNLPPHLLQLPGDVAYGVSKQFEPEGRTALRLTQFLSMYLQNVMPEENFGNLRGGGRLHEDMMYGEVIANVMGNFKIYSAGVYFDRYKWENQDGTHRELFGPWAYEKGKSYYAIDTAGLASHYPDQDWFRRAKSRFATNFYHLTRYKVRAFVRSDPNGTSSIRHEYFPLLYRAAPYSAGTWTRPHFRCDGNVNAWVVTYISPFFGLDSLRTNLEFRGVATVDVPLHLLEIHQCPQPFTVANAFKNTARCDYFSTKCVAQAGFPFLRGSYRCLCRLGFEYWHADGKFWIEGSLVELEYEKKMEGKFSRFDNLNCRPSSASHCMPALAVFFLCLSTSLCFLSELRRL